MGWLSILMGSRIARTIGAVLMAVLAVFTFGQIKKSEGRKEAEHDAMQDAFDRVEKGRDAVRDGRDKPPDQRLRDNDSKW